MPMRVVKSKGFTLVELSIVLVIIGLITGGVLVGQDLVESAKLKSQVQQFKEYDAALSTFYTKYDELPGDCGDICDTSGLALVDFHIGGFSQLNNGIIEGRISDTTPSWEEQAAAMAVLAGAGLISSGTAGGDFPESKLGESEIGFVSTSDKIYLWVFKQPGEQRFDEVAGPTPYQAWKVDSIMDDANPSAGIVRLANGTIPHTTPSILIRNGIDDYRIGGTSTTYNINTFNNFNCAEDASTGAELLAATVYSFADNENKDCPLVIEAAM